MPIMARGGDITPQGGAFIQNTREKAVTAFFVGFYYCPVKL